MIFKKFDAVIAWFEDIVSATCLLAVVSIATMSVVGRYVFHTGFLWADEVDQALLVAAGMIGSARAVRKNGHTAFTSFVSNRKSKKVRIALRLAINTLTLGLLMFMFVISIRFAAGGTMMSAVLRIPRMYYYMSIPIGFGLCIYEYAKVFKERLLTDAPSESE